MDTRIRFIVKGTEYSIPNCWEQVHPANFIKLLQDVELMASGRLSVGMVRVRYVCNCMGWKLKNFHSPEAVQNLSWIAEQVTFPFIIQYPDNDAALQDLDAETRKLCKRIDPFRLKGVGISRYLQRLPYKYMLDSCFCAQLVPVIEANDQLYSAYKINASFGQLTCSLTALQFIEARKVAAGHPDLLPLLAAILYYPDRYSSEGAQRLALEFANLPIEILQAIAFNFRAFVNFLFSKTEYRLLTAIKSDHGPAITTGALESLYNLSADGFGTANDVEQMNLLQYLTIIRKKLIESVRSLHASKMQLADIEKETGLPIHIIRQIV